MFGPAPDASELRTTGLALVVLAATVAVDVALGPATVLTTAYVFAAFVAALAGTVLGTVLVATLAYALVVASGAWNENFWTTDYDVRLVITALALGFAVLAAGARRESGHGMRRFQLLDEVSSVASDSSPAGETVARLADVIVPELADICLIDVTSGGRAARVAVRASGPDREAIEAGLAERRPSIPERMVTAEETATVEPILRPRHDEDVLRTIAHDDSDLEFIRRLDTRSSMTVPLVARGRRLGALTLITAGSGRRYGREDLRFARVLADRIAMALDSAGLFSDLQSVERRMDTVMAVLDEAVVIQDRDGRFLFANGAAAALFGLASAEELVGSSFADLSDSVDLYDEEGEPLDVTRLQPGSLAGDGGPLTFRTIPRRAGPERWLRARSRQVAVPEGAPAWVVTAFEDISDLKQSEFAQTLLARTGELLKSSDYAETLNAIAALAIPQLADWCSINVRAADGTVEPVALAHHDLDRVAEVETLTESHPFHAGDNSPVAEVLRSGELLTAELGFGSVMIVPLRLGGEISGTLNYVNDTDRRPFDEFDAELAQRIAERAAVALENARLATERAEIAETLQQGLLPSPLPEIPGWSVAALYRPAGEQNEVGGDFYEVFPFEEGWIVAIGDVTGRGAGAASITALARHTLRTAAALTGDPRTTLAALNRALLSRGELSLCTAALVALRPTAPDTVEVVSAGHPHPFVVSGRDVHEVICGGPVLGAFEESDWEPSLVRMEPGQLMVTYTDGVTEAEGPSGRFGEDRLREGLKELSSPAGTVRAVDQALETFTSGRLHDDAAIVAIMRDPAELMLAEGTVVPDELDFETGAGAGV